MEFLGELIVAILSSVLESVGLDRSLNTKKIDKNIEKLKNHDWFMKLYGNEKYSKEFTVNRHIRRYLQSDIRVRSMIYNEKSQEKFIRFLNKQVDKK